MKNINFILFFSAILFSMVSCKVDELPGTKNQALTSGGLEIKNDDTSTVVNGRSVSLKAIINNEQSREITECGVLYSTVQGFSQGQAEKVVALAENITENSFTVNIDNLVDDKTYYYYFYVNHSGGMSMSGESSFEVPAIVSEPLVAFDDNKIIDGTTLYGVVLSDGHNAITAYGVRWSTTEDMANAIEVQGVETETVDGALYYSVDLSNIINEWNNAGNLYFQMYAVNELGKGTSEVKNMERPKNYAKYEIIRLWVTDATTAKMEIKCVSTGVNLTSYGYVVNGTKVELTGEANIAGATQLVELTRLNDGDNKVYIYGVNEDGTSVETNENSRSFSTKILDKYDPTIRYFELDPIKVNDNGVEKYCYFLDRNLGARDAASKTDDKVRVNPTQDEAGWLFQWGRKGDVYEGVGHQMWDSQKQSGAIPITSYGNHYYKFITNGSSPYSWIKFETGQDSKKILTSLWNEDPEGGTHNPCPIGYRVPKSIEMKYFFNEENRGNMKIVAANVSRSASHGGLLYNQGVCYSTCTIYDFKVFKPYVWCITVNSDGSLKFPTGSDTSKTLGLGIFVRPVRVEVIESNQ